MLLVITIGELTRWGVTLRRLSPPRIGWGCLDTLSSIKKFSVWATSRFECIINEFIEEWEKHKYLKDTNSPLSKFTIQLGILWKSQWGDGLT